VPVLTHPDELAGLFGLPLSAEQLAAACAPLEPTVIVAGAGTGKTTVMAARVVWLIGTGQVAPADILGLTFTRRAAGELGERIQGRLTQAGLLDPDDLAAGEPVVATYDAFAKDLLREFGLRLGLEPPQYLLTPAQRYQMACDVVTSPVWRFAHLGPLAVGTVATRALHLDAELSGHLVTVERAREATRAFLAACDAAPRWRRNPYKAITEAILVGHRRLELLDLVEAYRARKQALGCWEFADQLAGAVEVAERFPDIGRRLRERHRVVLLDEFQDTSAAQLRLLAALFSSEGRGHPVTAVGDPLQAIYGWRGAASDTMGRFAGVFLRADGIPPTEFPLTINRRSGARILDVANGIAGMLEAPGGPAPDLGDDDGPLVPAPDCGPAHLEVVASHTLPDEVARLCDEIVAAHERGEAARWSDCAVLARQRADLGTFHDALVARDVPVEIVGLGGLLGLPEIAQVTATLRLIVDPGDNAAVVTLLSGPRWQLSPPDLAALGARAAALARAGDTVGREVSLMDAIDDDPGLSAAGRVGIAAFAAELARLRAHRNDPPGRLAALVVDAIGLRAELAARPGRWGRAASDQVECFLRAVAQFEDPGGGTSLSAVLAWLDAEASEGNELDQATPTEDDSVKLLTVHAAKGLEWEVVALPELSEGIFPHDVSRERDWTTNEGVLPPSLRGDADSVPTLREVSKAGLDAYREALRDEQRRSEERLAYVAVTRARSHLIAGTAWWRPGVARPRRPSRIWDVVAASIPSAERTPPGEANPLGAESRWLPWPPDAPDADLLAWSAAAVRAQAGTVAGSCRELVHHLGAVAELSAEDREEVRAWAAAADGFAEAARRGAAPAELPRSLSVSQVVGGREAPERLAAALARPMPQPAHEQAGVGTQFHEWLQRRFGTPAALTDLLEGPGDEEATWWDPACDIGPAGETPDGESGDELETLVAAFLRGPYAERVPLAIEARFVLALAGRQVRGRIDAVYAGETGRYRYQVVDWKTSLRDWADPLQLSLYRLAWASAHHCPAEAVDAVFYFVPSGRIVRPAELLDEAALTAMMTSLTREDALVADGVVGRS